jgi:hypothetical protein
MALSYGSPISLKGIKGDAGGLIYQGDLPPEQSFGKTGDAYIAASNQTFYVKTEDGWPSNGILLKGDIGMKGLNASLFVTQGSPADVALNTVPNEGDVGIDKTTGEIYEYRGGSWVDDGYSFKGPAGADGKRGTQTYTGQGAPDLSQYPDAQAGDLYYDLAAGPDLYVIQAG